MDLDLRPDTIQLLWKDPYPCRLPAGNALCGSDSEFPLTIANLQPSNVKDPVLTEWRLELELDMQADGQGELIALCSIDNAAGDQSAFYQEEGLRHGTNLIKFRIGGALLDRPVKLMLWNRGHRPYQITDLRLVRSSRSHPR
ncbi:MAG: hypothetical protein KDB93_08335 [Flavobacteriales bacterium]|nr:hypothetical protein [Flavobacteriales bacterium]